MRPAASMPDWFSRRYVCGPAVLYVCMRREKAVCEIVRTRSREIEFWRTKRPSVTLLLCEMH